MKNLKATSFYLPLPSSVGTKQQACLELLTPSVQETDAG